MSDTLHLDLESRSAVDLKETGAYTYAADQTTDIWCAAYAFGDEPIKVWRPGEPVPADIVEHVLLGGTVTAHNAAFERVMWHYILAPRYGWPEPATEQWRDTMVMSYAMALPGSLENAAAAVGLDIGSFIGVGIDHPRSIPGFEKQIEAMSDDEIAALPKEVRQRIFPQL